MQSFPNDVKLILGGTFSTLIDSANRTWTISYTYNIKRTQPYVQIQDHTLTEVLVCSRVPVIERSVVRESDPRIVQAFSHVKYVSFHFNCTNSF